MGLSGGLTLFHLSASDFDDERARCSTPLPGDAEAVCAALAAGLPGLAWGPYETRDRSYVEPSRETFGVAEFTAAIRRGADLTGGGRLILDLRTQQLPSAEATLPRRGQWGLAYLGVGLEGIGDWPAFLALWRAAAAALAAIGYGDKTLAWAHCAARLREDLAAALTAPERAELAALTLAAAHAAFRAARLRWPRVVEIQYQTPEVVAVWLAEVQNPAAVEHVTLAHCALTEVPAAVAAFTRLRSLSLHNNPALADLPPFVAGLRQLRQVSLVQTRAAADAALIARLAAVRADLRVES